MRCNLPRLVLQAAPAHATSFDEPPVASHFLLHRPTCQALSSIFSGVGRTRASAHLLGRIWAINCDRTNSIFVKHHGLVIAHVPFLSIASNPNSAVYLLGLSLRCSKKPFFPWSCTYKVNLRGNPYFRPRTTFKEIRGHWFKQILHMIQSSF